MGAAARPLARPVLADVDRALGLGDDGRGAAREAAGLSPRDLAARMGTSQAAIARLEAGGVGATPTTRRRAASALGLELDVELRPTASPVVTTSRRVVRLPRHHGEEVVRH